MPLALAAALAALVLDARAALEALAVRLFWHRRGGPAVGAGDLEVTEVAVALNALADCWAEAPAALPPDVTPPPWPHVRVEGLPLPGDPAELATLLPVVLRDDRAARALDAYADALRGWGREACACLEPEE